MYDRSVNYNGVTVSTKLAHAGRCLHDVERLPSAPAHAHNPGLPGPCPRALPAPSGRGDDDSGHLYWYLTQPLAGWHAVPRSNRGCTHAPALSRAEGGLQLGGAYMSQCGTQCGQCATSCDKVLEVRPRVC